MEGKLQTSFIPKRSVVETKPHVSSTSSVFSVIGWFIFAATVTMGVGVYFYESYISKSIETANAKLSTIVQQFDSTSIDHFVQLDTSLQQATNLLNNHVAFSAILPLIADNTLQSVQFTSFRYGYDEGGKVSVALSGKALDFASVALQSDKFFSLDYFKSKSFSGIALNTDGSVAFNFSATVDPSVLLYSKTLATSSSSDQTP